MRVRVVRTPHQLPLSRKIKGKIKRLDNMAPVFTAIGEDHVETIQHRIASGVDFEGRELAPLSEMTIALREWRGISRSSPLWETGRMKSSWRYYLRGRRGVTVKPNTYLDRKKVARDMYGGASTKLRRPVPVRNPFSLSREQILRYTQWVKWHVLGARR